MTSRRLPRRQGGSIAIPFDKAAEQGEAARLRDEGADIFELRLDLAEADSPEAAEAMASSFSGFPLVCTCRSSDEGGKGGEDYERLMLIAATVGHAHAIDVEMSSAAILAQAAMLAQNNGCELILSYHDLTGTPSKDALDETAEQAHQAGASIIKVVTTTSSDADVDILSKFLHGQLEKERDIAVMGMSTGDTARQSRARLAKEGSVFVFASVGLESAPGQPSLQWLAEQLDRQD